LGVIGPSRSVIKTCEDSPCSRYFFLAALVAIGCEAVTLEDIYRAVRIVGRVRGYELALGFLAATVVWAMFFVFQPKNDAAQGQTHQATSAESKEITSAKEVEDRLATYTLWLAIFTAVLAVSTIGLWIVTWRSGVRQSRDMENAIAAAQEANRISREGIIAEQRAWLTAGDLNIESEPVYEKSGITIVVSVQITNRGKTPALHVHTDMDMVFDSNAAPAAVMKLAEKNKTVDIVQWTRTALPNDPYRRRWVFTIERSKSLGNSNSVFPVIVGCVTSG
jgi:hypothetical protein